MNEPEGHSSYQANLQRGEMLRMQGRYREAEQYLQQAIGEQPSDARGYYELAFCYCNWTGHSKEALRTIDHAISLDPNHAEFFALRAWILGNLNKHKEAIRVAEQALELNPFSVLAMNAQTRAYSGLQNWIAVESNARRTLELNARNELAANMLAIALRQQGWLDESNAVTAALLAQVPDNAMAQSNAGWSALQVGDYWRANQHFMEALRLDPDYDYARRGLLHAFNSRVWIYRIYFQFVAWLGKHRTGMRYFLLAVIYIVYRLAIAGLREAFGDKSFYWIFVLVCLYLVIFGFGRSFGNLFLLLDRFARHALTWKETRWAIFAGVFYSVFVGVEIAGGAWPQTAILLVIPGFFLWGVLAPRIQNAFSRREAEQLSAN